MDGKESDRLAQLARRKSAEALERIRQRELARRAVARDESAQQMHRARLAALQQVWQRAVGELREYVSQALREELAQGLVELRQPQPQASQGLEAFCVLVGGERVDFAPRHLDLTAEGPPVGVVDVRNFVTSGQGRRLAFDFATGQWAVLDEQGQAGPLGPQALRDLLSLLVE